ncbi:MAG: hypothetical protein Fur0032_05470 [Terrimicrobiaceae bacterium]
MSEPGAQLPLERVRIERMAFGGAGVARLAGGMVCFVRGVIDGELVTIRVTRKKKNFAEAELVEIHEASPHRVSAPCKIFGSCGGCDYQHISYEHQLRIKSGLLADSLIRQASIKSPPVAPTRPSPYSYGYRNRIRVHTRHGRTGFFRKESGRIVETDHCELASPAVNEQLLAMVRRKPTDGDHTLREPSGFHGFRQVNDAAAKVLLEVVSSLAPPASSLIDAYCGAGFFTAALAPRFAKVIGIEWSVGAVAFARSVAGPNTKYLSGDVAVHLPTALADTPRPTGLLMDPPAEGCDPSVLDAILNGLPSWILYVSCNPSTLARDIARLATRYQLKQAVPVDMFPQTAEIESASLLLPTP